MAVVPKVGTILVLLIGYSSVTGVWLKNLIGDPAKPEDPQMPQTGPEPKKTISDDLDAEDPHCPREDLAELISAFASDFASAPPDELRIIDLINVIKDAAEYEEPGSTYNVLVFDITCPVEGQVTVASDAFCLLSHELSALKILVWRSRRGGVDNITFNQDGKK